MEYEYEEVDRDAALDAIKRYDIVETKLRGELHWYRIYIDAFTVANLLHADRVFRIGRPKPKLEIGVEAVCRALEDDDLGHADTFVPWIKAFAAALKREILEEVKK